VLPERYRKLVLWSFFGLSRTPLKGHADRAINRRANTVRSSAVRFNCAEVLEMASVEIDDLVATAQVVDACMRLKIPYRIAPAGITQVIPQSKPIFGRCIPVRHYGSVDIFLEVLEMTEEKGILIIDNGGRTGEACIGDLIVLEAQQAGVQAIAVWGLHRDTNDLLEINLPVWSYGSYPSGPARLDPRESDALTSAQFGDFLVTAADIVFMDQDGIVFVEAIHLDQILETATAIRKTERRQASLASKGTTMRQQFQFSSYLEKRHGNPNYTFRAHLASLSKSIEE
jgi:4-hydroxy-4-methyl-2-oxoglutarate aldolase